MSDMGLYGQWAMDELKRRDAEELRLRDLLHVARKALLNIATSGAHEWERRIAEDALAVIGDK